MIISVEIYGVLGPFLGRIACLSALYLLIPSSGLPMSSHQKFPAHGSQKCSPPIPSRNSNRHNYPYMSIMGRSWPLCCAYFKLCIHAAPWEMTFPNKHLYTAPLRKLLCFVAVLHPSGAASSPANACKSSSRGRWSGTCFRRFAPRNLPTPRGSTFPQSSSSIISY